VNRVFSAIVALTIAATPLAAQTPAPTTPQPPPTGVPAPSPGTAKPAQPAQPTTAKPTPPGTSKPAQPAAAEIVPPPDYVIGAEDVLNIVIWREKDLSVEVMVRPDGKVSVPLLNDVQAAGLTPEQFRQQLTAAAAKFVAEPSVTVIVRAINSRKVFITGEVRSPGTYPLIGPTTVLQLLALAGGTTEFAKVKDIGVLRTESGRTVRLPFNYREVSRGRRIDQNVLLRPGDTVVVP
jgi:polysaccharide export outer membrane protein